MSEVTINPEEVAIQYENSNSSYEMFLLKRLWDRTLTEKDIIMVIDQMKSHLPPPVPIEYPDMTLDEVTKEHIICMLKKYNNVKTVVAIKLGITIKTLYARMKLYGIGYNEYSP